MTPRFKRVTRPARLTRPLGIAVVSAAALGLFMIDQPPWQATATAQEAEQGAGDTVMPSSGQAAPASAPRNVSEAPYASGDERSQDMAKQAQADDDAQSTRTLAIPAGASATAPGEGTTVDNGTFIVNVDHAKVVRLPERTQTVIVGNPIIADVTVQRNGILVVTGKSFGSTNMIALDGSGALLAESMISVQAARDSVVTVQRGLNRESYSCTPTCQPSLQLGDNPGYFDGVGAQATQRNELATRR